jgi:hypothetical protein
MLLAALAMACAAPRQMGPRAEVSVAAHAPAPAVVPAESTPAGTSSAPAPAGAPPPAMLAGTPAVAAPPGTPVAPVPATSQRPLPQQPNPVLSSGSIDFASQVQPILAARCRPCHFPGGVVYARLPFDRAGTILELREKLFTRIKNENDRQTIRKFLAQQANAAGPRRGAS